MTDTLRVDVPSLGASKKFLFKMLLMFAGILVVLAAALYLAWPFYQKNLNSLSQLEILQKNNQGENELLNSIQQALQFETSERQRQELRLQALIKDHVADLSAKTGANMAIGWITLPIKAALQLAELDAYLLADESQISALFNRLQALFQILPKEQADILLQALAQDKAKLQQQNHLNVTLVYEKLDLWLSQITGAWAKPYTGLVVARPIATPLQAPSPWLKGWIDATQGLVKVQHLKEPLEPHLLSAAQQILVLERLKLFLHEIRLAASQNNNNYLNQRLKATLEFINAYCNSDLTDVASLVETLTAWQDKPLLDKNTLLAHTLQARDAALGH